ncbi:hypothetical protein CMT75_18640 [Elizabethkingia anophelis]|uniref:hypothetical protein n=1 Tax=Elizabethkingia sp. M8 TaxID=2796140 RepID=UPI0019035AFE|nr:hypothetical protein [Elizabethkingia sp. M8]MDV3950536.1 hypothetical protein [Elizabethkingia anophelis]QQM26589.1 hypothetical protein JCR23_17385 [Elizabethkingia sp. M8]
MNTETKNEKASFLFETIDDFFKSNIKLIADELKPNSKLDETAVMNILLDVYNRGATQTKVLYPCPMCQNLQTDCIACNLLVEEINSYK